MILQLSQLLEPHTLEAIIESIDELEFASGALTAGKPVKAIKHNQQIVLNKQQPAPLYMLFQHLSQHPLFQAACHPKQVARVMLNRYQADMYYGNHVDDAFIDGVRTDISFTFCLSSSDQYQGGELVLCDASGERSWKLDKGEMLIYPSTYLHRVNPVSQGQRIAMVGWLQSRVRQPAQREILFDLKQSLTAEFTERGKTEQYDRLSKSYSNLLRQWAD